MAEEFTLIREVPGKKRNKTLWIILGFVIVVLCCALMWGSALITWLVGMGSWLWEYPDELGGFGMVVMGYRRFAAGFHPTNFQ